MKERLAAQDPVERAARSLRIADRLFADEAFQRARTVCFYASLPAEADTSGMIDRALSDGKRVLVPRADLPGRRLDWFRIRDRAKDLEPGTMGIPEPVGALVRRARPGEAECVLVPGLGFDRRNNRLGRGAGFYDRFLAGLGPGAMKIGIGFSFQVVDALPVEDHDVRLDAVLTD